jgi:hypothetical protein
MLVHDALLRKHHPVERRFSTSQRCFAKQLRAEGCGEEADGLLAQMASLSAWGN